MWYNYKEICDAFDKNNAYATQWHINLFEIQIKPWTYQPPTIVLDNEIKLFDAITGFAIFYKDYGHENEFLIHYKIWWEYQQLRSTKNKAEKALENILNDHNYIKKLSPEEVEDRIKEINN